MLFNGAMSVHHMFQVQYYLMDFDEILYEHMPKPVLFNLYRIFDNKNMADTQTYEVWATLALLSKFSNHNDQRNIGTKFVLNIVIQNNKEHSECQVVKNACENCALYKEGISK